MRMMESFKGLKHKNINQTAEDGEFKEVAPGIIRRDIYDIRAYQTSREINGLTYEIEVFHEGEINKSSAYSLGFGTKEHGEDITNQGIGVFNKVVDAILETIIVLHEKEEVNKIIIDPSKNSFSPKKRQDVVNELHKAYDNNKKVFNGFHYKNEEGGFIKIEDGIITSGHESKGIELVDFTSDVESYLNDKSHSINIDLARGFLKHLGLGDKVIELLGTKKVEQQRRILFERTLKMRFPGLSYEVNSNEILIHLDSLDKKYK